MRGVLESPAMRTVMILFMVVSLCCDYDAGPHGVTHPAAAASLASCT
jgi:hypothetical protein